MSKENDEINLFKTIIYKALIDSHFKDRLCSNPKKTLKDEFNLQIPEDKDVVFCADTKSKVHVIIPYLSREEELSDADLAAIAGGALGELSSQLAMNLSKGLRNL